MHLVGSTIEIYYSYDARSYKRQTSAVCFYIWNSRVSVCVSKLQNCQIHLCSNE